MKKFLIINIIAIAAMFVGFINAIAFKENVGAFGGSYLSCCINCICL